MRPILLAASLALLASASSARAAAQEGALWLDLHLALPIGSRFSGHLVVQPRFDSDISQLQQVVVRPWLQADLSRGFTGALGYDAHVVENPVSTLEQRIWQQLGWSTAAHPLRPFARVRLEERFFEGSSGTPVSLRLQAGFSAPLGRSFEFVTRDEIFLNLNEASLVKRTGLRQNRFYAGVGRPLAARVRAEVGYQMQWVDLPGSDLIFHTLMLSLRFDLPGLR